MSDHILEMCCEPCPDVVVHLAAEVGGCSEENCLNVNVLGTLRLLRHFVDCGVKRFVLASSIAAAVGLSEDAVPRELPIGDDYPCDAKDPYGMTKALMEEVAYYFQRNNGGLDITLFRIGSVLKEDAVPVTMQDLDTVRLPFIALSTISVVDVVSAIRLAIERQTIPGVHRMNLVAPWTRTPIPVADTLARLLGHRATHLDLTSYEGEHSKWASLFSTDRLLSQLGFVATVNPRTMKTAIELDEGTE